MHDRFSSVLALLIARREVGLEPTPVAVLHTLSYLANVIGPIYRRLHPGFTFVRTHYRAAAYEVVEALDYLHWNGLIVYRAKAAGPLSVRVTDATLIVFGELGGSVAELRAFARDIVFTLSAVGASDDMSLGHLLFEEPGFRAALWKSPKDEEQQLSNDSFFGLPPAARAYGVLKRAASDFLSDDQGLLLRRAVLRAFADYLVQQAHKRTDKVDRESGA